MNLVTFGIAVTAALGVVHLKYPPLERAPFAPFLGADALPLARASANAFGASGEVRVRFALPEDEIEYPLEVQGDPAVLTYGWVRVGDTSLVSSVRPLKGAELTAPSRPGFYRLALVRGSSQRVLDDLTIAVLVPFREKVGGLVNGYRIGTYLSERMAGRPNPRGFLEVTSADLDLHVTKHLRVSDFVSHDRQVRWPKYAAVTPQLLDKLELVLAELARWHGRDSVQLAVHVKSGFRSPHHNQFIAAAARDSRHQYGDAADIAIDADGDGRLTAADIRLVGLAVEIVEQRHPELVGGLGMYLSAGTPYVHIDARGKRVRWRG